MVNKAFRVGLFTCIRSFRLHFFFKCNTARAYSIAWVLLVNTFLKIYLTSQDSLPLMGKHHQVIVPHSTYIAKVSDSLCLCCLIIIFLNGYNGRLMIKQLMLSFSCIYTVRSSKFLKQSSPLRTMFKNRCYICEDKLFDCLYSGIPIFRTSKGMENWFEKS